MIVKVIFPPLCIWRSYLVSFFPTLEHSDYDFIFFYRILSFALKKAGQEIEDKAFEILCRPSSESAQVHKAKMFTVCCSAPTLSP